MLAWNQRSDEGSNCKAVTPSTFLLRIWDFLDYIVIAEFLRRVNCIPLGKKLL
jgi:hypothetical protein